MLGVRVRSLVGYSGNRQVMIYNHLIRTEESLRAAFEKLNVLSGGNMTLFAVDSAEKLVGSMTDGDLRRAVIAGSSLDDTVGSACNRNCMRLGPEDNKYLKITEARKKGIAMLPVVNADGEITELLDLRKIKAALPIDAVLMAGGKGERLRPLTLDCPKPLLEVGGKPIIDYNVDELLANGVKKVFVTVNYLKEQIKKHFSSEKYVGKVECVEEPKRLGTMGSLALVDGLTEENVLVMNSDLLTTLSFEEMYLRHIESGAALTVAAIPYTVSIPFAILRTEGREVKGLAEKPTYNYFANAGVYIMRREIVSGIEKGEYLDAPDLIEQLIADGKKVEYFPIDGTWVDIGSPDDYRYANELMRGRLGR